MKIVFFGTPQFAKNILQNLTKKFEILAIVTQEDKPFGRKKELKTPPCKEFALTHKIPLFQPNNIKEIVKVLEDLKPNIILVVAYGKILPKEIIEQFYCINIHASILPKSRGASPMQDMILKREKFVGLSIIKMDNLLDNGDILALRYIKNNNFDIEKLSEILSYNASKLIIKVLSSLSNILPLRQISIDSSYCTKIARKDGVITFSNALKIYTKFLAYKTFPQISLQNGTKLLDISLNEAESTNKSGEILAILKNGVIVGCQEGSICVKTIQAVGKNKLDSTSYLNGKRLKLGDILS